MSSTLIHTDEPCHYELAWQSSPCAIIIRIHRNVATYAGVMNGETKAVKFLQKAVGAESFCGQLAGPFGFDQKLLPCVGGDGFVELEARLPSLNTQDETAQESWLKVNKLIATLQLLFSHLNLQVGTVELACNRKQLFAASIYFAVAGDSSFHHLGSTYSPTFLNWLAAHDRYKKFAGVSAAMQAAHNKLRGHERADPRSFAAQILHTDGYLRLSCRSVDGSYGLHPEDHQICIRALRDKRGCRAAARNITDGIQQLTLLAGLARLHDIARQRMN